MKTHGILIVQKVALHMPAVLPGSAQRNIGSVKAPGMLLIHASAD